MVVKNIMTFIMTAIIGFNSKILLFIIIHVYL